MHVSLLNSTFDYMEVFFFAHNLSVSWLDTWTQEVVQNSIGDTTL